jgi:hypothetical protein
MNTEQHESVPPAEGIWILDDTGKTLRFVSEEELENATEATASTKPKVTPAEVITEYLSNLSPPQKTIQDKLCELGWDEAAIYNMLTLLENQQRYNCAKLRQMGYTETEIQRLDALGNQNMNDFSHLERGTTSAGDGEYQLQLYLLEEAKRRRLVMLGEE